MLSNKLLNKVTPYFDHVHIKKQCKNRVNNIWGNFDHCFLFLKYCKSFQKYVTVRYNKKNYNFVKKTCNFSVSHFTETHQN